MIEMMESSKSINLRIKPDIQNLIDQAAEVTGKTRTEFMLEASHREAINTLLDRCWIPVDATMYEQFLDALNAPPTPSPNLQRLLATRSPWE